MSVANEYNLPYTALYDKIKKLIYDYYDTKL